MKADDTNPVLLDFGSRAWWVFPDHVVIPVIRGGDGEDGGGDGSEEGGTPPPEGGDRTFTQAELNRIAAAEAAKGKRSAVKETLEALGFSSLDEAKNFFQEQRDKQDSELTEAQKLMKAAEEKDRKATEREQAALTRELNSRIERALEAEGVDAKSSPKVRKLVEDVDVEATDDEITASVASLKEEMPHLFGEASEKKPPAPPGVPPKPPAPNGGGSSSAERARALLGQRHPTSVKN